jgi:hypothetical protein
VNTFREIGFTHRQRLAVLYNSDPHHRVRLFTLIAKLRGWKVQAFDSFEEAFIWLSAGEQPSVETEFTPRAKKVPVHELKALRSSAKPPQPSIIMKTPGTRPLDTASGKAVRKKPSSASAPPIVRKIPPAAARPGASPH